MTENEHKLRLGIFIITYNISTEIFILQIEAIKKFCKDNFEIQIIDNSSDDVKSEGIEYHAGILEVSYMRTRSSSNDSSDSHAFAANFSYNKFQESYDLFAYFDHDLFPIHPFSAEEILADKKVMAGVGQEKKGVVYFWPGILFFRKMDEIDFAPDHKLNLDTGGGLHKIIDKYGKENCSFFNEQYIENPIYKKGMYNYYALINNGVFLHCVALSGWNEKGENTERVNAMLNILREKTGL